MKLLSFFRFSTLATICLGMAYTAQSQSVVSSHIRIKTTQVAVLGTADCDIAAGSSDFAWHFIATDNTLGYSNNTPTDTDFLGDFNYTYRDGNDGPYTQTPNDGAPSSGWDPGDGIFFDHTYCGGDVPTNINFAWRAYENDAAGNYSTTNSPDGNTGVQNATLAVPASTGTASQLYTASGSSGSCPQTYTITFEIERTDILTAAPTNLSACQGDTVSWAGMNYTLPGSYYDTLASVGGCDSILTLNLEFNPILTATATIAANTGDTACMGEVVIFTATPDNAGSNPSYQWFLNGQNLGVVNNTFATTVLTDGDVILCIMAVDTFCVADSTVTSNSVQMSVDACSGTKELETAAWTIYPNPAHDYIYIQSEQRNTAATARLYSTTGQLLRAVRPNNYPYQLDINDLATGVYLLQIIENDAVYSQKIVIER